jgi:flagellar export protein FliJ
MARFHDRLARVFEWYQERCRLEENRFGMLMESAARAQSEIEAHRKEVLAQQMELIQSPNPRASELAALGSFCRQAKKREARLREDWQLKVRSLESQRKIVLAARQRVQLVEKLRGRRLNEFRYQEARELEELASETYLASFARGLNENNAN